MRLSVEFNTESFDRKTRSLDLSAPDLRALADVAVARESFFATLDRVLARNPVPSERLQELAVRARSGPLGAADARELEALKAQAVRQGRAVAATVGFFLKFNPYADARRNPRAGQALPAALRPDARGRRRRGPRGARARPGLYRRTVRRRDEEGDVAAAQRRLRHLRAQHRRQPRSTSRTSSCCRQSATAATRRRSRTSCTATACGGSATRWRPRGRAATRRSMSSRRWRGTCP